MIEVALGANVELDDAVVINGAVIAAYASDQDGPRIPFWTLLFNNVVLGLLGSDDFPVKAKVDAARELTTAAATGALTIRIADPYPLEGIADAHNAVDQGVGDGRVLIRVTGS